MANVYVALREALRQGAQKGIGIKLLGDVFEEMPAVEEDMGVLYKTSFPDFTEAVAESMEAIYEAASDAMKK